MVMFIRNLWYSAVKNSTVNRTVDVGYLKKLLLVVKDNNSNAAKLSLQDYVLPLEVADFAWENKVIGYERVAFRIDQPRHVMVARLKTLSDTQIRTVVKDSEYNDDEKSLRVLFRAARSNILPTDEQLRCEWFKRELSMLCTTGTNKESVFAALSVFELDYADVQSYFDSLGYNTSLSCLEKLWVLDQFCAHSNLPLTVKSSMLSRLVTGLGNTLLEVIDVFGIEKTVEFIFSSNNKASIINEINVGQLSSNVQSDMKFAVNAWLMKNTHVNVDDYLVRNLLKTDLVDTKVLPVGWLFDHMIQNDIHTVLHDLSFEQLQLVIYQLNSQPQNSVQSVLTALDYADGSLD